MPLRLILSRFFFKVFAVAFAITVLTFLSLALADSDVDNDQAQIASQQQLVDAQSKVLKQKIADCQKKGTYNVPTCSEEKTSLFGKDFCQNVADCNNGIQKQTDALNLLKDALSKLNAQLVTHKKIAATQSAQQTKATLGRARTQALLRPAESLKEVAGQELAKSPDDNMLSLDNYSGTDRVAYNLKAACGFALENVNISPHYFDENTKWKVGPYHPGKIVSCPNLPSSSDTNGERLYHVSLNNLCMADPAKEAYKNYESECSASCEEMNKKFQFRDSVELTSSVGTLRIFARDEHGLMRCLVMSGFELPQVKDDSLQAQKLSPEGDMAGKPQ